LKHIESIISSIKKLKSSPLKSGEWVETWKQEAQASFWRRKGSLLATPGETAETPRIQDGDLVRRIMVAYRQAVSSDTNLGNSMWNTFSQTYLQDIHKTFLGTDVEAAIAILRNPAKGNLFYGFDNLILLDTENFKQRKRQELNAANCMDGLARFAEAFGIIPLENMEAYGSEEPTPLQADELIDKITKATRWNFTVPNPFPNEHGLRTSRGIVSYRTPQALYQAWKMKQLMRDIDQPRILEIGGGLGRTAYYSFELGMRNYSIVDIPTTLIAQAYFLGRTLGEDKILLYGESQLESQPQIKLLPPQSFLAGPEKYDLIANIDSLTEFDKTVAAAYWDQIRVSAPLFWSVNHEQNTFRVRDIIDGANGLVDSDRNLYWMRRGYVEELVRFKLN